VKAVKWRHTVITMEQAEKNGSIFFSYAPDIRKSTDLKVPRLRLLVLLSTATN